MKIQVLCIYCVSIHQSMPSLQPVIFHSCNFTEGLNAYWSDHLTTYVNRQLTILNFEIQFWWKGAIKQDLIFLKKIGVNKAHSHLN